MIANNWTAPCTRYHGKITSPCTHSINRISTKIAFSDHIRFPKRNGIHVVCINVLTRELFIAKSTLFLIIPRISQEHIRGAIQK